MSSWRKLMTPVYDKYFSRNPSTSTLLSSQYDQGTPLPSTVRESQKSIGTNAKLSKLQEEMNKLKKELNKYPSNNSKPEKKQNSKKNSHKKLTFEESDQYSFSEDYKPLDTTSPITGNIRIEDSSRQVSSNRFGGTPESSLQHYSQTIDDHFNGRRIFERLQGKRLIDEYPVEEDLSESSDEMATRRRDTDYHDEDRDEVHLDEDINPAMTYVNPRHENREIIDENHIQTEKPKRKTVEKTAIEEEDINESLKKALANCQSEISGLRELVMSSKHKIDTLEGELEREKIQAHGLKRELTKQTTLKPKRKVLGDKENSFNNSIEESEEVVPQNNSAKRAPKFTTEVDSDQENNKNLKNVNMKAKVMTMNSSGKKAPVNACIEIPKDKSKKSQGNSGLNKSDKKYQNTMSSTKDSYHGLKDMGVQCDCMLDDIADNSHQEEIEKLQDEISGLKMEARSLKSDKNMMIETFQEIIKLLASENTSKKNRSEEIKEDFGSFFDEFRRKANEIVIPGPVHINKEFLDTMPTKVPNTTMRTRHGRTELSDNLMYSPSIYESNFEGLGDSKINIAPFTRREYTEISDI